MKSEYFKRPKHKHRRGTVLVGVNIFEAPVSTRIDPDILKTEISFLRFSLSSQANGVFEQQKRQVFENRLSRVKIFENFRVYAGRKRRFTNTIMSYIITYIALRMPSVVMRKGRKRFEYAT